MKKEIVIDGVTYVKKDTIKKSPSILPWYQQEGVEILTIKMEWKEDFNPKNNRLIREIEDYGDYMVGYAQFGSDNDDVILRRLKCL